jgi:hypothetical protein
MSTYSGCGCFSFLAWITNKEQNKSNEKKTKNPKKEGEPGDAKMLETENYSDK